MKVDGFILPQFKLVTQSKPGRVMSAATLEERSEEILPLESVQFCQETPCCKRRQLQFIMAIIYVTILWKNVCCSLFYC